MEYKQKALDSVKGIAAAIVAFTWHYQHFGPVGEQSPFYVLIPFSFDYGYLMVEVFFMLSGFGMMMGYKQKVMNKEITFPSFMYKRVSKLYPLHFVTLLVVTILGFIYIAKVGESFVYPNFDLYHFILNLFFLQDGLLTTAWSFNSPSWCLSIFMVLYAVFYLILKTSKKDSSIIVKFFVTFIIGAIILILNLNYPVANELIARGLTCFAVGVFLYYIYQNKDILNSKVLGIVAVLACVAFYITIRFTGIEYMGNLRLVFIMVVAPASILSVLFVKPINIILQFKPLLLLGSISMEIYLLHYPVQYIFKIVDTYAGLELNFMSKKVWLVYVISVLLVAIIYKKFLSKPILNVFSKTITVR